jgi:PAS domain S-box-containing protein
MKQAPAAVDGMLRLLAEQATEHAMIILDTDARIRWCNPAAETVFAVAANEMLGQPFSQLFTPDQIARGVPEHELATASANTAAEDDRWMARPDGSVFWATGVLVALRDDAGRLLGFGKILRNRTDLREQIETLKNQVGALENAQRRKDVFLSTLSHELRNPLAPLSDAVRLIRGVVPPSAEVEFPLKVIERQVESLRRLVDDLLDLARIGAGKIELKKQVLHLQDVLHRAAEGVAPLVRQRRHHVEMLLPPSPIIVEADRDRLVQVFVNLLNNAAKFTPEGGRIWVKATVEGDEAVVHIEDNGVGVPHDVLPRIFELFTQVESSRGQSQGGLGIGLSLVKTLVTLHGGSVQVDSDGPGKGSIFSVRLPVTPQ